MPSRILKESICTSESLAYLSAEAEVLFYRLIVKADDFGLYYGSPKILASLLFPLNVPTEKKVSSWLAELVNGGLVATYRAEDGRQYLKLLSWDKHQNRRATKPKYPLPQEFDNTCSQGVSSDNSDTCAQMQADSSVYDAIAPAAAELAIMYIELAYLMDRAFPDTESGDDLTKKVRERSIFRTPATAAIRKGYFEDGNGAAMDVPIGTRFSGDNLNYTVTEKIATGQFRLLCETPGAAGNQYQGNLFPIDYVEGLGAARLADILINGEDEESDEDLLDR